MRFVSTPQTLRVVQERIRELTRNLHDPDADKIKLLLKAAVPEYTPYLNTSAEAPQVALPEKTRESRHAETVSRD